MNVSEIKENYSKVTEAENIPQNRRIAVDVNCIETAVFNIEGEFHDISNRCPHKGAPLYKLVKRRLIQGTHRRKAVEA